MSYGFRFQDSEQCNHDYPVPYSNSPDNSNNNELLLSLNSVHIEKWPFHSN